MSPEEIKKLLGGYATGTLTAEEQQALFAAALEDQELFDALAREQTLRDLLSDAASRAELLSALDTPAKGRFVFWEWLRRPMVAGLAVAGIGGIAVVAVWQGTRVPASKPAPQIMAQLRIEPAPIHSSAEIPPPTMQQKAGKSVIAPKILPPPRFAADSSPAPVAMPPPAPPPAAIRAPAAPKEELAAAAEERAGKRTEAMSGLMARKSEAQPAVSSGQVAGMSAGSVQDAVTVDARALFYANPVTPGANAFVPASGGGGTAPPVRPSPEADAATRTAKAVSGMAASMAVATPRLGLRISIRRNAGEADLTTVLDPGETVRLKVIPNADGFLYVMEGARLVANGAAQRLRPFETPELRFEGSGQKLLYVMFSRRPQSVNAQSVGSLTRRNVVQASAEQERATYAVSGEAAAQEIIVPVTLTYR